MAKARPSDPVAALSVPETATVGDVVMVDASASHDPGGFIQSAQLNFGDGVTVKFPARKLRPHPHVWYVPGTYTVTLSVVDNTKHSASASATITVAAAVVVPPVDPPEEPEDPDPPVEEPPIEEPPVEEPPLEEPPVEEPPVEEPPIEEPLPPPSGERHDYFEALRKRPEHFYSLSMRDLPEFAALTAAGSAQTSWSYSREFDALKWTRVNPPVGEPGYGKGSLPQLDIPNFPSWRLGPETGSIIVVWDQLWPASFRDNAGGVTHLKVAGFRNNNKTWWTLMQSPGPAAENFRGSKVVAVLGDNFVIGNTPAPAMTRWEPTTPAGTGAPDQQPFAGAAQMYHSQWVRNIVEIRVGRPHTEFTDWNQTYGVTVPPNEKTTTWHMVSRWVIHETEDATRVLYRVPVGYAYGGVPQEPLITNFRFTLDSSKSGFIGPWEGYFRNFVVLTGYRLPEVHPESDPVIFQRPVR